MYTKITRWITTTSHKDIGTLYLWFSIIMFFFGGFLALIIRAELYQPGMQIVNAEVYNQTISLHGLIMIFGVIVPALVGFANWMIPLMIGAKDMALPRVNNLSFWLLPLGFVMLLTPLFLPGPAADAGWTFYAPLSSTYGPPSMDFMIFAIHLLGISSILTGINVMTTILNLRKTGLKLMEMPIFVWSWFITSFMLLVIMPVLAGTVTMVLLDRHFGTSFFNASGGGHPLLFQHLFWFFGHPEVYVMILPAFGIISEVFPTFSRKPLFGFTAMIYALLAIAVLSFLVWAHHMFVAGIVFTAEIFFMVFTMAIAIPTGIKIFNWIGTTYKGSLTFETPMLFACAFVVLFTIGGLTGIMLSVTPADYQYHDSYFVVGHLHYVLVPGALFAIFSGAYYWLPRMTGRYYNERLAKIHFWLSAISVNFIFFPMHFLGLAGMPRRIPDYAIQYTDYNIMASIGAFVFGFSQLIFLYIVIQTIRKGKPAPDKAWEGAKGLEWAHD